MAKKCINNTPSVERMLKVQRDLKKGRVQVFTTKNVISEGIRYVEVKEVGYNYLYGYFYDMPVAPRLMFYSSEWHLTYEDALKKANKTKESKIKYFLKQLPQLELLQFTDPTKENTK